MPLSMNDVMATLTKTEYVIIDRKEDLVGVIGIVSICHAYQSFMEVRLFSIRCFLSVYCFTF
jgi:hypothetical protein